MKARRQSAATRSFTLVEVMVAVVVLGILVMVGIPSYRNFVEMGRTRMCADNLGALKAAFDIYIAEHNVVPGTLSELSPEEVSRAYARIRTMRSKDLSVRWVSFLETRQARGYAYAVSLIEQLGKGNTKLLTCPSDARTSAKISYGINNAVAGKTRDEYMALPANMVVIADSDTKVFSGGTGTSTEASGGSERHKSYQGLKTVTFANAVTKGGWVKKNGAGSACASCANREPKGPRPSREKIQEAIACWSRCR
ncbi:MAG TPA: prepilin-type N-terminal cleavage/methylation domain-containing protein [Candidatus Omnitrophota bacterium]|nr:prepilin-type N-terminal cleavage/methylation domain-containing protein [Candidatus Omnitrophota bacterium]HQO38237.1 prepilin-type N-terminal cleavage/methylation domain-containing protein [Candidatus Omnitrophota bacterium]HQQ06250.1 prepilin-type N-terminal cleavage/methylation domain-containing protein [Candidatus Omnitrophota bacterium]